MESNANEPRSLIFSARLYGALLNVYPSEFRREYGGPMHQFFRDCCRRALYEAGPPGLLALWARTMLDTVQTALEEHVQRGVEMSQKKFIKLGGWALMLGGLALVLGFLASARPEYNPYNLRSLPIDRYANAVEGPLSAIAMFLLAVGMIGLFVQYGPRSSSFGRASLGLSAVSGVVGAAGSVGLAIVDQEPWWSIFFMGFVFECVGLVLFGLSNLRQPAMPYGNALPVIAGVWIPLFVIASLILERGSGQWVEMPAVVNASAFLLTTIGLFGLGYVLQSEPQGAAVATVV